MFVAVWPSAEARQVIAAMPRPEVGGLRWMGQDNWHVTLRFFGNVERDEAWEALASARLPAPPVVAQMGPATTLIGSGVLCAPVGGLHGLAAAVESATAGVGMPPRPGRFRGHLTLARARDPRYLRPLVGTPLEATWTVGEVTLVSSRTRPDGAHYTVEEFCSLPSPG
ncbi:MAG TPA: 2'-5' RNA ligase family protein [Acidimicrobiales bacterium]|nr:2'-5' RNA ligase family protein [Acidimicrobiales bacterium]